MKRSELFLAILSTVLLSVGFFFRVFVRGDVPFPGDVLVSEFKPWRTYPFLGYAPGAVPNKAQFPDTLRQLYPWRTAVITAVKDGTIPLWNPYNFAGSPLLANVQSSVFYPLNTLFFVLPQIDAWTILVILQPALALFFTYAYMRKIGLGVPSSILSASSYAFSSFMVVWLEYNTIGHVTLWLPLILLSVEHMKERITTFWLSCFIVACVSALFAGHIQVFGYLYVLVAAYVLFRIKKREVRRYILAALFISLTAGSIQLIPTGELLQHAARSAHDYAEMMGKILVQPWQLVMFVVRDFFGNPATRNYWPSDTYVGKVTSVGILPLLFFPLALTRFRTHAIIRFFAVSALAVLLLVTAHPITALLYALKIPIISSSSPTQSVFILSLSVAIVSGFGFELWITRTDRKIVIYVIPLALVFVFLWFAVLFIPVAMPGSAFAQHSSVAFRNLGYATALFALGLTLFMLRTLKSKSILIVIFILAIHIFDLWYFFQKFTPMSSREFVFPKEQVLTFLKETAGIDRFWGHGSAAIDSNFATQYALYSPEGYDPLYPKRYGEFISASLDGLIASGFSRQTRSDAAVAPSSNDTLQDNPYRMKVLSLLGVRYILDHTDNGSTEKSFPPQQFSPVYRSDGWTVYENHHVTSRVVLASSYETYTTKEEFSRKFFRESFDPSATVLLEQEPDLPPQVGGKTSIAIGTYQPNDISITTQSDGNRILVLSDTNVPGWKAFVDGIPAKILSANYAFRAVSVPKGVHTIRFLYRPISFTIGVYVSVLSVIALAVLIKHTKRHRS